MLRKPSVMRLRKVVGLEPRAGKAAGTWIQHDAANDSVSEEARSALDALLADLDQIQIDDD